MVLHQLIVWVQKVLDQQELAMGVFLDIEGAYNYTSFDPCVLHFVAVGSTPLLSGGLGPPRRAVWLRQLSTMFL
jgi:hypothetical protein